MPVTLTERLINVNEYYRMAEAGILAPEEKVELIEGKIINMSPIGAKHAYCVRQLNKILLNHFSDTFTIGVQDPIRLNNMSEPQPDLIVAKGPDSRYLDKHPTPEDVILVIEVAESTLNQDRDIKIPLYASSGIAEYWIVNIPENTIEVYGSPKGNTYSDQKTYSKGQEITLKNPDARIEVNQILGG